MRNSVYRLIFLTFLLSPLVARADAVVRGPYLQSATPTSIVVRWRTDVATDSKVSYQALGGSPQATTSAALTTEHEVTLTGLQPDTHYTYSVGSTAQVLAGGDASFSFVSSPVAGTDEPAYIWVIGDSGTADTNAANVRDAFKSFSGARRPNVWLMLGDNAYPKGTDAEYQAAVFDMYPEVLRQTPVWPTIGNHDIYAAAPAYKPSFTLPIAGEAGGIASGTESYYSYDFGNIHFIVLDSQQSSRAIDGPMLTWLANDLAANDKHWTIAYWHHPPYTKGSHDSDTEFRHIEMRQNVLPMLEAYGVDLVLGGHSHSYERSKLIDGHYGDSTTWNPVTMLLDGGDGDPSGDGAYVKASGGAAPYEGAIYAVAGSSGKTATGSLDHPVMHISLSKLGSLAINVAGNRMEATFVNSFGRVFDEFTLIKGADTFGPAVVLAAAPDLNTVEVLFSEPVNQAQAETVANYQVPGVTINSASLGADQRTVTLAVATMPWATDYEVTVAGVTDLAANALSSNDSWPFATPAAPALTVELDLLPFDAANEIDPAGTAVLTMYLFSTSLAAGESVDFDAATIDPASLRLGAGQALNVLTPFLNDLDSDSDTDLAVGFRTEDSGIVCDDVSVTLTGSTFSGDAIVGMDSITTTNCSSGCHP